MNPSVRRPEDRSCGKCGGTVPGAENDSGYEISQDAVFPSDATGASARASDGNGLSRDTNSGAGFSEPLYRNPCSARTLWKDLTAPSVKQMSAPFP